jgi:hypothetical protein
MKFKDDSPFATSEAAERKLLELANAIEADHTGRISVGIQRAVSKCWRHLEGIQRGRESRC